MKNLAIECSGTAGSVALFEDQQLMYFAELSPNLGSVQTLAPVLSELVTHFGSPDLISVTVGPGSFTGLRVGLSTAKALAFAWKLPVAGVDSLKASALRVAALTPPPDARILPVINAFRGQLFAAAYIIDGTAQIDNTVRLNAIAQSQVVDASRWSQDPLATLGLDADSGRPLYITGPGLRNIQFSEPWRVHQAPESAWHPTAVEVGQLGWDCLRCGNVSDADSLQPNYLRASAAEEQAKR